MITLNLTQRKVVNILLVFITWLVFVKDLKAQYKPFGYIIRNGKTKTSIPFEAHDNLIVFKMMVNDTTSLNFILDTGVQNAILLDKSLIKKLGLKAERGLSLGGLGMKSKVNAYVTSPAKISIGTITNNYQRFIALDTAYIDIRHQFDIDIDGIIGFELFSRFVVDINYAGQRLTFYEPGKNKVKKSFDVIPIQISQSKPYVNLSLLQDNQQIVEGNLIIDTGASHALILKFMEENGVKLPSKKIIASLGRGLAGEVRGLIGRINEVQFGGIPFEEIVTMYPIDSDYFPNRKLGKRLGTVGGDVLSKMHVVFDYKSEKIYVKKNKLHKNSFEYDMSGLELSTTSGGKKIIVQRVRLGSPGHKAGVHPGDIIRIINHPPEKQSSLSKVISLFRSEPGKIMVLSVTRGKQTFLTTLILERII